LGLVTHLCSFRRLISAYQFLPPVFCLLLSAYSALYYRRIRTPEKGATQRLTEQQADNVTKLLLELSKGDRAAVDSLLPVIYDELRKLAANYLRRERPDHTLQPTALVHEAYLRLVDQTRVDWQNRAHFFGVAAQIMRRLLVDHARKHNAEKRGQDFQKLSLDENIDRAVERSAELIALDDALKTLATFDEQKARMVELRYFGGLSIEETAKVLGVTPTTIKRHWRLAKAWLHGEMQKN
jgi:RNA polymerase sigma factor (TIGR02999 family)